MLCKLFCHTVKILIIIRDIHIRLCDKDRHLLVFHLKYTIQISHIMMTEHGQYHIHRYQRRKDQSQSTQADRPVNHNICNDCKANGE